MANPNILITGGEGRLAQALKKIIPDATAWGRDKLDVTSFTDCERCAEFDVIIHCAAVLTIEAEAEPGKAWRVNVTGTSNVVLGSRGRRVVFISSDYVFGKMGREIHREADQPDPVNVYGISKKHAESIVEAGWGKVHKNSNLILRAPFRYGPPWPYDNAFDDQISNTRWIGEVAPDIVRAALSDLTGILHIGGPRTSVFDLVSATGQQVRRSSLYQWNGVPLPGNCTLDSSRWQAWAQQQTNLEKQAYLAKVGA